MLNPEEICPGKLVVLSTLIDIHSISLFIEPSYDSAVMGHLVTGEVGSVTSSLMINTHGMSMCWIFIVSSSGDMGWSDRTEYLDVERG